jgi:hypothetical protein
MKKVLDSAWPLEHILAYHLSNYPTLILMAMRYQNQYQTQSALSKIQLEEIQPTTRY